MFSALDFLYAQVLQNMKSVARSGESNIKSASNTTEGTPNTIEETTKEVSGFHVTNCYGGVSSLLISFFAS